MPEKAPDPAKETGMVQNLEHELEKQRKVISSLMDRVERGMDASVGAFSIFQRMITLENEVEKRTSELNAALERVDRTNVFLKLAKEKAEAAEEVLRFRNFELSAMMEELRKAQALLVRSEKLASIGTLSAGVAHEILNPLNIISTIVQLMRAGYISQEMTNENLLEIETQIKRAVKITDNLRKFAHIHKEENRLVNLRGLFEKTAMLLEHDLTLDNIFIAKDFDPEVPRIYADEDKLAQVFLNLLTNARDALKGGQGGLITVKTRASGDKVIIAFSDNGPGMAPEVLHKIFDPFFTTKDPGHGTGLGLSIVHSIVETHNGMISVESEKGHGTKFIITLPFETGREHE